MEWKKVSPEMVEKLDCVIARFTAERKKMFGCPVYFVNSHMFAGVHQDNLFIRLSEKDRAEILALNDEVSVFEPMEGRAMKDYVVIPDSLIEDKDFFDPWLNRSFEHVSSLAPKEPKSRTNKQLKQA